MKKITLLLCTLAFPALAAVTLTDTNTPRWQLVRGTTNVGTPHTTEAACLQAARSDAEARKAAANYRCVYTRAFTAAWTADTPPPVVADPHNGGVHPGSMPSYNPATVPAPNPGSGEWQVRTTGEMPYPGDGVGAFRTVCTRSHFNRDDSLVFPNQPGRAHLHMYFGNTGSNAASTPESLLATGNSTCRGGIANRSSYWVPAIIDTRDGTVIDMDRVDVYYKTGYRGVAAASVRPFPTGLRMIAGDMTARAPVQWGPAQFRCGSQSDWGIPANCTGPLEVHLMFPQCWDGRNLSAPDHKSHMAYANNGCPASHAVPLPEIS